MPMYRYCPRHGTYCKHYGPRGCELPNGDICPFVEVV